MKSLAKNIDVLTNKIDQLHSTPTVSPLVVPSVMTGGSSSVAAPVVSSYQPFHTRSVKLDFLKFDRTEPLHWLFRTEQFFVYYGTPDDQRLIISSVHMHGRSSCCWVSNVAET